MELNQRELDRYVRRVADRFPVERALLGGARVEDAAGAAPQRERGPEYVVVLVSEHFDGIPWLEIHCYTAAEYHRKVRALPILRRVARRGLDLSPAVAP